MSPLQTSALAASLALALACIAPPASAGPGAHGPGGEHLDGPAAGATGGPALPRLEAKSDAFELVAELRAGELVMLVDRYDNNEPVLGAKLEVESGALKASAAFRIEQGDYVVTDPALLKQLATPGQHALVFTLVAGKDNDLLDGTLITRSPAAAAAAGHGGGHGHGNDHDHGHDHHDLERAAIAGAGVAGIALLAGALWWRQRRRAAARARQGGL